MKVLEGCHGSELGGGHFGRDKTLAKINERYYWMGMVEDVKDFCRTCEKCQRANRFESNPYGAAHKSLFYNPYHQYDAKNSNLFLNLNF